MQIYVCSEWKELINISNFPWDKTGYKPNTTVSLKFDSNGLYVKFNVKEEQYIRATYKNFQDPVHNDSCVEFFVNFTPETKKDYLNFEINPLGTLHLAIGECRQSRHKLSKDDVHGIEITPLISGANWSIEVKIPTDFIKRYYEDFGFNEKCVVKCNFYKCGDETTIPHYGCWNNIELESPDFHRPEFFGGLKFQENQ